jgi:hypothetical protein
MLSYSVSQNMVLSGSWTKRVEADALDSDDNRVRNKIDSHGIDIVESPFRHDRIEALGVDRAESRRRAKTLSGLKDSSAPLCPSSTASSAVSARRFRSQRLARGFCDVMNDAAREAGVDSWRQE